MKAKRQTFSRDKRGTSDPSFYGGTPTSPAKAVNGTHKAGKRKRGVSVLKKTPKTQARALNQRILDSDGDTVATFKTIYRKRG